MRHLSLVPPPAAADSDPANDLTAPASPTEALGGAVDEVDEVVAASDAYQPMSAEEIARRLAAGEDAGGLAQRLAEAHLAACQEAEWAVEEGEEAPESPACAPFCSCETCVVREILYAAWPVIEAATRLELAQESLAAEQS